MTDSKRETKLSNLFDDFDQQASTGASTPTSSAKISKGSRRGSAYRSALDERQTSQLEIARAVGKKASVAGKYLRRSFTFRPDQLEVIEKMAAQLGLSQNDLMRWFTDLGIEAVTLGERPLVTEEIRRKYDPGLE